MTILRYKDPDRPRTFRVPGGPWLIPLLGAASCIFLMVYLPPASWWRFIGWLVLGMAIYFAYGYRHSTVGRAAGRTAQRSLGENLAALGFFLAAAGLFLIPHDRSVGELFAEAGGGSGRALTGLVLIGVGFATATGGLLAQRDGAGAVQR